jgi:hypothetical protein
MQIRAPKEALNKRRSRSNPLSLALSPTVVGERGDFLVGFRLTIPKSFALQARDV